MIVYQATKEAFMNDVMDGRIADIIEKAVLEKLKRRTPSSEYDSWQNSLNFMFTILLDGMIPPTSGVSIEYNIPVTRRRIDFMISGYDADGVPSVVVIELKQWKEARRAPGRDDLVLTPLGGGERCVVHPSYQAASYAETLRNFLSVVDEKQIALHPCAYLHNYDGGELNDQKLFGDVLSRAPLFVKTQRRDLQKHICSQLVTGDKGRVVRAFEAGTIRPSRSLQTELVDLLKGNPVFVLLDDQKVAYEEILALVRESRRKNAKSVVIVEGGPGTGKSVVAVNLLVRAVADGVMASYVTKNSAPREVFQALLKGGADKGFRKGWEPLFQGSGRFYATPADAYDLLLVDEAHRLNFKSGIFQNLGENQMKELINAARCSVFFIDENQRVTMKDAGSIAEIRHQAALAGVPVTHLKLTSQFRCRGSNEFMIWVDDLLGLGSGKAPGVLSNEEFPVVVCDTPAELEEYVRRHDAPGKPSRMMAGYCWEWPKAGRNDPDVADIVVGDWGASWNLGSDKTFAITPESVGQVGCVHTVQGLEFEHAGVLIGPDLRYEDGAIVTDYEARASSDQSLRGIKKLAKENPELARRKADLIIRNTYRTLLTRGMKGCAIHCVDKALNEYIKTLVGSPRE